MSFNNSFVAALPMGAKAYQDYLANQRADEELGLRRAADKRATDLQERTLRNLDFEYKQKHGAWSELQDDDTEGGSPIPSAPVADYGLTPPTQGGMRAQLPPSAPGVVDYGLAGPAAGGLTLDAPAQPGVRADPMPAPVAEAPAAMAPRMKAPRSPLEEERRLLRAARKGGDVKGVRESMERIRTMEGEESDRTFITGMMEMEKDPARQEEFAKTIEPALNALTKFQGIQSAFHFDPSTRSIVEVPYGVRQEDGTMQYSSPRSIPLTKAMPYLLAMNKLNRQNGGDPAKLLESINAMTDKEREKLISDHTRITDLAFKQGAYSNQSRIAAASESNAATNASRAAAERSRLYNTQLGFDVGDDGSTKPVMIGIRDGKNGPEEVRIPLTGKNFMPGNAMQNVDRLAKEMVDQGAGRMVDGRMVPYTIEEAREVALNAVKRQFNPNVKSNGTGVDVGSPPPRRGMKPPTPDRTQQERTNPYADTDGAMYDDNGNRIN